MAVYVRVRLMRLAVRHTAWKRVATLVLEAAGEASSELSIELIGDGRMRRLNREYRKKDRTTDVLAFAMRESACPDESLLGDVVISVPTARRQAKENGRALDEELAWLLVHGVLHLCGYDHERSDQEARRMRRREQHILRGLRPIPRLVTVPKAVAPLRRRSGKME
ncbi:MAG: rRNA maturation RNase YbeY [Nitrospira sp.]|jgi:probable rRNA maturation factor|nr:rRNA maturation RNase YbeY [Nitrospira sp.]